MDLKFTLHTIAILGFWTCYFMFDVTDQQKSCVNVTTSMYCPKDQLLAKGEIYYYHDLVITSLTFCFMTSLHLVFALQNHRELSMLMVLISTVLIVLYGFSHSGVDNFAFHCMGFLVGVFSSNILIFMHILYMYMYNKRLTRSTSADTISGEEGEVVVGPDTIELRNNQPGCFFDINTRTHILNFDVN